MDETNQKKQVAYNNYLFRKDFPLDEEIDLRPDNQRRLLGTIDRMCEEQGGVFLGYDIYEILNPELMDGIQYRYASADLVGTNYVESRIILDASGNSPRRHSMNTTIKCVVGTENEDLLRKLNDFYGDSTGMVPYTERKTIS